MKIETQDVSFMSEIVVVDSNPEMADFSNPHGYIHDVAYFVVVTNRAGVRLRHCQHFFDPEKANRLCDRIAEHGSINLDYWDVHHPVYGSPAYEANIEEEIALEKKRS